MRHNCSCTVVDAWARFPLLMKASLTDLHTVGRRMVIGMLCEAHDDEPTGPLPLPSPVLKMRSSVSC